MSLPPGHPKESDVPLGGTALTARGAPMVERVAYAVERGQGRAYDNGVAVVGGTARSARVRP